MHVTLNSKAFKQALGTVGILPGIPDKTVLLRTEGDTLFVEAGASGNFLSIRISAEVKDQGRFAVDGEALSGLALPAATLTLASKGAAKLAFTSGRLSGTTGLYQDSRLSAIEAHRPPEALETTATVSVPGMLAALRSTRVLPAVESVTHGTRVRMKGIEVTSVGTDVFRAARYQGSIPGCVGDIDIFANTDFLIGLFSYATSETASVGAHKGLLRIEAENFDAYIPLLQSRTDNISGFISSLDYNGCLGSLKFPVKELKGCLTSSVSIIGSASYEARLQLSRNGNDVSLTAESPRGSATTTYEATAADRKTPQEDFTVSLNVKYLQELIDIFPESTVDLYVWKNLVQLETPGSAYTSIMPTTCA